MTTVKQAVASTKAEKYDGADLVEAIFVTYTAHQLLLLLRLHHVYVLNESKVQVNQTSTRAKQ